MKYAIAKILGIGLAAFLVMLGLLLFVLQAQPETDPVYEVYWDEQYGGLYEVYEEQ
jgi:hypothetical protein